MGPKIWGLGDTIDSGRHGTGQCQGWQWQAQGDCAAGQSQDGRARPKMATGAMPKAARQTLYDVIIQTCMAIDGAGGDAGDSGMYGARARRC